MTFSRSKRLIRYMQYSPRCTGGRYVSFGLVNDKRVRRIRIEYIPAKPNGINTYKRFYLFLRKARVSRR